jgi:D-ribulokinase
VGGLALGLDFGTSGARSLVLGPERQVCWQQRIAFPSSLNWSTVWLETLALLLEGIPADLKSGLGAIALDGTSGTVLLCAADGTPLAPPWLYAETCPGVLPELVELVPLQSAAHSASSSLAKLLGWRQQFAWKTAPLGWRLLHQADWLAAQLHGQWGLSDWHNALKLGYDPGLLAYPAALSSDASLAPLLPIPLEPGQLIGPVTDQAAQQFGLPALCQVCAGTKLLGF